MFKRYGQAKLNMMREALAKRSWKGETIVLSGDTDCYQPLEAHYRLTRGCLEALRDAGNPAGLITKSFLVARGLWHFLISGLLPFWKT